MVITHITIENKKYVLIREENYKVLQKSSALKHHPEKTFSIAKAKALSKKLIRKWSAEKQQVKNLLSKALTYKWVSHYQQINK